MYVTNRPQQPPAPTTGNVKMSPGQVPPQGVPFYLQGTQTAGLFQQPPTDSLAPYEPGQGMPLYEPAQQPQLDEYGRNVYGSVSLDTTQDYIPMDGSGQGVRTNDGPSVYNPGGTTWAQDTADRNAGVERDSLLNTFKTQGGGGSSGGGGSTVGGGLSGGSSGGIRGLNLNNQGISSAPNIPLQSYPVGQQPPFGQPGQPPVGQQGQPPVGQQGGTFNPQSGQVNPQAAIDQYQQTPGYQMLFNNQQQQFEQSPGYQYAVDQAMGQVQNNASARGLLGSGSMLRALTDRAQGMASQEYGNWWNRQAQQFGDYQNRLAGLAGGPTGAEQAYGLGQAQGSANLQTGSNLGSLFGNQGNSGFGGILNTGAAQANAITQAGNQQAQVGATNQGIRLAGALQGSF